MLNRINAAAGSRRLPSSLCLDVVRKKKKKKKRNEKKREKKKKKKIARLNFAQTNNT